MERAGVEFLNRRLRRASAVPPAERSPEVAAFVDSVGLLREAVCEQLPLTWTLQISKPALAVDDPSTQRRLLVALYSTAWAEYVCPDKPVTGKQLEQHVARYLLDSGGVEFSMAASQGGPGSGGGATPIGRDARFSQLAWVLVCIVRSIFDGRLGDFYKAATAGHRVATLLATPDWESECRRQLKQLRREHQEQHPQLRPLPPLTVQQLRYLCCLMVASAGSHILQTHAHPEAARLVNNPGCPAVTEAQVAELLPVIASSKDALLQLEPHNPMSQMMAAMAVIWENSDYLQPFLDYYLQAHSLGQQQRSDLWVVRSAAAALSLAGHHPHAVSPRSLEAVLTAFQQAGSSRGGASGGTTSQAVAAASDESASIWHAWAHQDPCQCSGCGERAVGLRRCARCNTARYCR